MNKKRLCYWLFTGALLGLGVQYVFVRTMASVLDVEFHLGMMNEWPLFVCLGMGLGGMGRAIRTNCKSYEDATEDEAAAEESS